MAERPATMVQTDHQRADTQCRSVFFTSPHHLQDASSADIRKAYRKLSLTLHPDKNKDENAETQFRQLVAIYEVLKDDERRQRYDDILINGLPDWRQPVFYYRRVRKMSNAELALLLFIILTVGHYAVVWSIYLEKQLDELLSRKKREKKKKTGGKSVDLSKLGASEKNERLLMKPQWHDLLPCKLGIWFCLTLKALPHLIQDAGQFYAKYKETRLKEKEDALTRAELETLQKPKKIKVKKPKPEFPVYTPLESAYIQPYDHGTSIEEIEEQMDDWLENRNRTQKKQAPEWTEEDLSQLTRSMVKFPGGTPGRWEKIAHELGRSVTDTDWRFSACLEKTQLGSKTKDRWVDLNRFGVRDEGDCMQYPYTTPPHASTRCPQKSNKWFSQGSRFLQMFLPRLTGILLVSPYCLPRTRKVPFPTGTVRLSELKSTAQHSRPGKATVALPDDIITQREDAQQAAGAGRMSEQEQEEQEEQEAAVPEGQPRRRKPARLPEAAAKAEPEEKFRGKRQKDFDISEQTASSDEESQRKERSRTAEEPWTQNQQKLLELALQQYPKGSSDRWDKIAKCVPSKSKEDCIARYKLLVELVQKKKQAKS
ncbi:PREDICTED: dnaJ homolog subfamily C member 1 [Myotis davidii]|uniref:dnaJ homolog subfamily C member 1 n=1 Tax=Myotis davidii TaxID=225400 RepID=UPI000767B80B|nr:PREDICTED: dnaJ homolog subfamily C member 1 [Myotis davidii]